MKRIEGDRDRVGKGQRHPTKLQGSLDGTVGEPLAINHFEPLGEVKWGPFVLEEVNSGEQWTKQGEKV